MRVAMLNASQPTAIAADSGASRDLHPVTSSHTKSHPAAVMRPKLVELGALIDHQIPALCTIALLRFLTVAFFWSTARACLPKRALEISNEANAVIFKVFRGAMISSLLGLVAWGTLRPPEDVCSRYESNRVLAICAMISLVCIVARNDVMTNFMALSTLKAVSGYSSSALMLGATTAIVSMGDDLGLAFYIPVFIMSSTYSFSCYDPDTPVRTHGATIAAVFVSFYYTILTFTLLVVRVAIVQAHLFGRLYRGVRFLSRGVRSWLVRRLVRTAEAAPAARGPPVRRRLPSRAAPTPLSMPEPISAPPPLLLPDQS